jgi:chromosome segregation ATPase
MKPPDQPTTTPRTDTEFDRIGDALTENLFSLDEGFNQARRFARALETELTAAQSECDLHRNRLASILWSGAIDKHTCGDVQKWAEDYTAELTRLRAAMVEVEAQTSATLLQMQATNTRLRAEVERLRSDRDCEKRLRKDAEELRENAIARAERAEAELKRYTDAVGAKPWATDEPSRVLLDRITAERDAARLTLTKIIIGDYAKGADRAHPAIGLARAAMKGTP